VTDTFRPGYITDLDIEIPQGGTFTMRFGVVAVQLAITGPTVVRNTAYTIGTLVTPLVPNGYAYECQAAGTTHATNEPTWPTVVGKTVTDGTVTWRCEGATSDREYLIDTSAYTAVMEVRDGDFDGATVLEASTTDGRITVGYTPRKWANSTAYTDSQQVVPTLLNGFVYEAVVGGTSHASTEPTWPTTLGTTVTDGTVTWRAEHVATVDNGMISNLDVTIAAGVTELLTDWGKGVWTIQLIEAPSTLIFWADGVARLRRESTY
jgi:hypothetical protein